MATHKSKAFQAGVLILIMTVCMLAPLVFWYVRNPDTFFSEIVGFGEIYSVLPYAWALMVVIVVVYVLYTFWAVPFVRKHALDVTPLKCLDIFSSLVSGLFEELLFRKLLMDSLERAGVGIVWQVVLSALAFGVLHVGWALFVKDKRIVLPAVFSTIGLGTALAILYLVAGRIVLVPALAHALINLAIEPWLILSTLENADRKELDEGIN